MLEFMNLAPSDFGTVVPLTSQPVSNAAKKQISTRPLRHQVLVSRTASPVCRPAHATSLLMDGVARPRAARELGCLGTGVYQRTVNVPSPGIPSDLSWTYR